MRWLLYGETNSARNAVHLLFAGERVKAAQVEAHPAIRAIRAGLHGQEFLVIPVAELVRMKLSSYRDKDRGSGIFERRSSEGTGRCLRTREVRKLRRHSPCVYIPALTS